MHLLGEVWVGREQAPQVFHVCHGGSQDTDRGQYYSRPSRDDAKVSA